MNHITLFMIGAIAGMGLQGINSYSKSELVAAFEIGKAECPAETTCYDHGELKGLKPLKLADIQHLIEEDLR